MTPPGLRIAALRRETFPLRAPFTISRGSRTEVRVLYLRLQRGEFLGHAECMPYPHYGESFESVEQQILDAVDELALSADARVALQSILPAGAARNALDCALWDLDCKASGRRAWEIAGMDRPAPAVTVETVVIDQPQQMFEAARKIRGRPILKVKLDAQLVIERLHAVHEAAPSSLLLVDANEAWSFDQLVELAPRLRALGVAMIEQPLPARADAALAHYRSPVPLCADESCHTRADLDRCAERYGLVNIKLDKTGGLTEALALFHAAKGRGLGVMVGCMLGTSLAMAPATLIAARADFVDLDGPLWMARDREPALQIEDSRVGLPAPELWG